MIYQEECDMSLKDKQALPLETKLAMTRFRIREWYEHWNGKVDLANSGGRDSSLLAHIIKDMGLDIPNVFLNTGLEFPEIVRHIETFPNLIKLQPIKSFNKVIAEEGYPILSKITAKALNALQRPTEKNRAYRSFACTGIRRDGQKSMKQPISNKWQSILGVVEDKKLGFVLLDAPFKISNKCCDYLKKKPAYLRTKETGRYPITGTMASEGGVRRENYNKYGCNRLGANPTSNPISFWTHQDILDYISAHNVKIADVYAMGYERTGCVFCMFGVHLDHRNMKDGLNRFQLLYKTHPKLWNYCMDRLGVQRVMEFLQLPVRPEGLF